MSVAHAINHSDSNMSPDYLISVLDPNNNLTELLSATAPFIAPEHLEDCVEFEVCQNSKAAKKAFKKPADIAVILLGLDEACQLDVLNFVKMVRNGMKNRAVRVVACGQKDLSHSEKELINNYGVDAYRTVDALTADGLSGLLIAELKTFKQFKNNSARRDAEINLLTTLAQFSRAELSLTDCFREFNNTICIVSGAHFGNVLLVDEDDNILRSDLVYGSGKCSTELMMKFVTDNNTMFNGSVKKAVSEKAMQICLTSEDQEHQTISNISNSSIAGSLVFPLKSYDKTLAVVQCFLPKEQLDYVSVELIKLVEKSSEQLSVLLERHEAEMNLQKQYERLKNTLSDLKNAKAQLYQSEKMASVGQLAAGIAHEINNPLTFVMGNFAPLDEYVASMSELLKLHDSFMQALVQKDHSNIQSLKNSIVSLHEQADMNFVLEDIHSLVSDSRDGLSRVKEIIANLKEFSHVDAVDVQMVDLHRNIDTTLKMLTHQLKVGVEVVKEYGDIPQVPCNAGLLNQVFMNFLQNAIHAVEGKQSPQIKITTCVAGEMVNIIIRDNGSGIPEDKLGDIFNPFFTTKPVGKGTGLGLSVSYGIIEKHKGKIEVDTQLGEYTEFIVSLPLKAESE